MSIVIFVLLGSEHSFSMRWEHEHGKHHDKGPIVTPSLYNGLFSMIAFVLGAITSIASGYLGMKIATYANARVTVEARKGIAPAFECGVPPPRLSSRVASHLPFSAKLARKTSCTRPGSRHGNSHSRARRCCAAFRSGAVMGFLLTSMGLIVLYVTLVAFRMFYGRHGDWVGLFEAITGYGFGGSSIALFGRVGGGIYTKAADVGADLVGKVEKDIPEDDPRNPAVIAGAPSVCHAPATGYALAIHRDPPREAGAASFVELVPCLCEIRSPSCCGKGCCTVLL